MCTTKIRKILTLRLLKTQNISGSVHFSKQKLAWFPYFSITNKVNKYHKLRTLVCLQSLKTYDQHFWLDFLIVKMSPTTILCWYVSLVKWMSRMQHGTLELLQYYISLCTSTYTSQEDLARARNRSFLSIRFDAPFSLNDVRSTCGVSSGYLLWYIV